MPTIPVDVQAINKRLYEVQAEMARSSMAPIDTVPSYSRVIGPSARYEPSVATTEEIKRKEEEDVVDTGCKCTVS